MTIKSLALLNFASPYHVGWREAEPIIEGFSIHRAMISVSVMLHGSTEHVDELCELRVSAALPAISTGECYKLLLPFPSIPSKVNLKKYGLGWATLRALVKVANLVKRAIPVIENVRYDGRNGKISVRVDDARTELCVSNYVVHDCEPDLGELPRGHPVERIERHLNRLDRGTNAADTYGIVGYRPRSKVGVLLQGDQSTVDYGLRLLKVIGEIGIGGYRSRGFGSYVLEAGNMCDSEYVAQKRGPGPLVLLGSYAFNESIDLAFVNKKLVAGYSGPPSDSYVLPYMNYIGSGSVVHVNEELKCIKEMVSSSRGGAFIVFNPPVATDHDAS